MARSIIVEVRQAVIAGIASALEADPANYGVSCTYGWQGGSDNGRREEIYTHRPRSTHEPASLKTGRNFRNERMDFDIVIRVLDPAARPEEVDARLMDLGQIVEEFIADNKGNQLEVDGLNWIIVTAFELENRLGQDTGSASLAQYTIRYDARLT